MTQGELINDFNHQYHRSYGVSTFSQYENGKRIPEIDALQDFARYFNVSVSYLLGESDVRNPDAELAAAGIAADDPPVQCSVDEIEIIKIVREQRRAGASLDDIIHKLTLAPEAVRIAGKWAGLDDDGRFIVGSALVQEERRLSREKSAIRA